MFTAHSRLTRGLTVLAAGAAGAALAVAAPAAAAHAQAGDAPVTPAQFVSGSVHPRVGVPIVIANPTYDRPPSVDSQIAHQWYSDVGGSNGNGHDLPGDVCVQATEPGTDPYDCRQWIDALTFTPTPDEIGGRIHIHIVAADWANGGVYDVEDLVTGVVEGGSASGWIDNAHVQTKLYGEDDWMDADRDHPVIAGNPARLRYDVHNVGGDPAHVALRVLDENGVPVDGSADAADLAPDESSTHYAELDTWKLAYDADGHPKHNWTYSIEARPAGVETNVAEVRVEAEPRPVVIVPGYGSNAGAWFGFKAMLQTADRRLQGFAVGDGLYRGRENAGNPADPSAPTYTIHQNAQQAALYISDVRESTGADHLDLVGESSGGLVGRDYVQNLMPDSDDAHPVVAHLVQLGTPNLGSPCADRMVEASVNGGARSAVPEPATLQLTSYFLQRFNERVTDLRGVKLSNLVGTGYSVPCGSGLTGDGFVPEQSAEGTIPAADLFHAEVSHADFANDFGVVTDYVVPRLTDSVGYAVAPSRKGAAPVTGSDTTFDSEAIHLAPGESRALHFVPPAGTELGATALAPGVELELRDPAGEVVDPAESTDPQFPLAGVDANHPAPGTWTLRVFNTGGDTIDAPVSVWSHGKAGTDVIHAYVSVKGKARLRVLVRSGKTAQPSSTVTAVVSDGTRAVPVVLHDDGKSWDKKAGDGVYGAKAVMLPAGGDWLASFRLDTPTGRRFLTASVVPTQPANP